MQGLGVRIARALNAVMNRHGAVVQERYHARILRTTKVKRVRSYLQNNANHHYGLVGPDPYASGMSLTLPHMFLLRLLR